MSHVPTEAEIEFAYWVISAVAALLIWFAADYFLYRRKRPEAATGPREATLRIPNPSAKPQRYFSANDKERLSDALYELRQINNVDLAKLIESANFSSWHVTGEDIRDVSKAKALKDIGRIDQIARDMAVVRTNIYQVWLSKYDAYADLLRKVLGHEISDRKHPLNDFGSSIQKLKTALQAHAETQREGAILQLVRNSVHVVEHGTEDLQEWQGEMTAGIKEVRAKILDV